MSDSRDRSWSVELQDGRKMKIVVDLDGAWLVLPEDLANATGNPLTSSDAERIGQALFDAAAWLADQKPAKRGKAKR